MQRLTTYTLTSLIARQIDVQSTKARVNSEVSLKLGHFVRMCCNWKIFKFNTEFSLCLLTNGENFQSFSRTNSYCSALVSSFQRNRILCCLLLRNETSGSNIN